MSDDLIERLRARADMHVAATPETMLREAAACIRELKAELAAFELESNRREETFARKIGEQQARAETAEAELAALREGRGANPLPRREGVGDWTLRMDLLSDLNREVQSEGWDGCTAEVTEIIALSVERRILSALSPAPVSAGESRAKIERRIDRLAEAIGSSQDGSAIRDMEERLAEAQADLRALPETEGE